MNASLELNLSGDGVQTIGLDCSLPLRSGLGKLRGQLPLHGQSFSAHPLGFGVESCRIELLVLTFRTDLGHLGLAGQKMRLLGGSGGVDGLVDAGTTSTTKKATVTAAIAAATATSTTGDTSLSLGNEIASSVGASVTGAALASFCAERAR